MFFKKHLIDCDVLCIERETIYNSDDDGRNTYTNMYSFSILQPDYMVNKILYEYDENSTKYNINTKYKAKFNTKSGEFTIIS